MLVDARRSNEKRPKRRPDRGEESNRDPERDHATPAMPGTYTYTPSNVMTAFDLNSR